MAFPADLTTYTALVDGSTTINAALLGQYRAALGELEKLLVGPAWRNVLAYGADPSGTSNSAGAFDAAIAALGPVGGVVIVPPGTFRMDTTVIVPSRVAIRGAGMYATKFFAPAAAPDIPIFEVDTTAGNTMVNTYGQVYGVKFEDFEIRDRASADTPLTQTGRSEDHHGILIHDSDNGLIRNVNFRDLRGYAMNFSNVAREWLCENVYVQACGDSAESVPGLFIGATSGDASNTIMFMNSRFLFCEWRAVYIDGSITGVRLMTFDSCQFEGGGNGSGGAYGNPWPHDLVFLGRMQDAIFTHCNFSNPGAAKWCLNLDGNASENIYYVTVEACRFNGQSTGGGIRVNRITKIAVNQTVFTASTATEADYYVEAAAGVIAADIDNVPSANPTAGSPAGHFRGRETGTKLNYGAHIIDASGGGFQSLVAGKPTTDLSLGAPAPNGIRVYDITNLLWWERIFIAGVGDIWMPQPGQVVGRKSEVVHGSNTTENSVYSYTIPAGAMSYWGGIRVDVWGDFSGTGVGTATLRIKLGGTTLFADATPALVSGVQTWHVWFIIRNNGAVENAQRMGGMSLVSAVSAATSGSGDIGTDEINGISAIQASSAIDMASADRVVEVTWQHSANKVTTVRAGQAAYQ